MKRALITIPLLLASIAAMGSGLQRGLTTDRFEDLVDDNSTARRLVSDATPWFAVRLDDGLDDLVDDGNGTGLYKPFLDLGIPVSLAINYDDLGTAGNATEAQILSIIAEFDAAGVDIEIVQHGDNTLFSPNPFTMSYADLVDEIDPSELEAAFGKDVISMAQPGDASVKAYVKRNYAMVRSVLDSVGIKYWDVAYGGAADSTEYIEWAPHVAFDAETNPSGTFISNQALFPGAVRDPLYLPPAITLDLGNYQVERDASEAWGASRYDDWLHVSSGASDPTASVWRSSFRGLYEFALANGWGLVFALHDSGATDEDYDNGEVSPHHIAWVLDQLRTAGAINLGTVSQVYEWALGRYAPGTELVNNKQSNIWSFEIGDTSGVEYGWVGGWGSYFSANGDWDAMTWSGTWTDGVANKGKFDRAGTVFPTDHTGSGVTGGYGNRTGAFFLDANNTTLNFIRTNLPEGRYRLSVATNAYRISLKEIGAALAGKYFRQRQGFLHTAPAYGDTMFSTWWRDANESLSFDIGANHDLVMSVEFTVDGREGINRLSWTSATQRANYAPEYWLDDWRGGIYLSLGVVSEAHLGPIQLHYLGPLEY